MHTRACRQKIYKALHGDGYEIHPKTSCSSATPGTDKYGVVLRTKEEEEEEPYLFEKLALTGPEFEAKRKADEAAKRKAKCDAKKAAKADELIAEEAAVLNAEGAASSKSGVIKTASSSVAVSNTEGASDRAKSLQK